MDWIKSHIRLIIVMIVIMVLVAIIVLSAETGRTQSGAESAVETAAETVDAPVSSAGNGFTSLLKGLVEFRKNQKENYELKKQIEELNEELSKAELSQIQLSELRDINNSLGYVTYDDAYDRVTAQVTAMDGSDIFNTFTIGAGSDDGISTDDFVINEEGLVGRVTQVGSSWAKVTGIIDADNSVSFSVKRDQTIQGIVTGSGSTDLDGYIFDDTQSIVEGDTLVTSGLGMYPQGIEIATVKSVNINSGTKKKTFTAQSPVNFYSLRYVTVLTGKNQG